MTDLMFDSMIRSLASQGTTKAEPIKLADYESWRNLYTFDALQNLRYGQSFCNRFGITDNILYYSRSAIDADRYILENYVSQGQ